MNNAIWTLELFFIQVLPRVTAATSLLQRRADPGKPPGISLKVALNTGGRPNRDCLSRIVGNHRPRNDDGAKDDRLQRDD
jgi:hypothetical protein